MADESEPGNVLSVLDDMCDGEQPSEDPPSDCRVIGHDCAASIVVEQNGQVYARHAESATYVNESLAHFEASRAAFESRWADVDTHELADDSMAAALGEELRELVFGVDPTLRSQRSSWWLDVIDSVLL